MPKTIDEVEKVSEIRDFTVPPVTKALIPQKGQFMRDVTYLL
jgi:hypothetical protein